MLNSRAFLDAGPVGSRQSGGRVLAADRTEGGVLTAAPTEAHKGAGISVSISSTVAPVTLFAAGLCTLSLPIVLAQQVAGGGPPQSPASQLAAEGTAALSGVVTDPTTKQPIPGVTVYLGFQGRGAVSRLSRRWL